MWRCRLEKSAIQSINQSINQSNVITLLKEAKKKIAMAIVYQSDIYSFYIRKHPILCQINPFNQFFFQT